MAIITPELARTKSNENAWARLSIIARRALNCAIDNGKTKVRVYYRNHYEYFWKDIKILWQIGYEVKYFDILEENYSLAELSELDLPPSYIEINW